ncbi:MAG: murein biosynthesis integral membrane protein MurJ [candidate division WOR-3 bacterium]
MRLKSVLSFFVGTLISRILGFFREMVFAYALGSTYYADAVVVAIRIPTMLRGILAEGISQNAFIPVFTRWKDGRLLWALIFIVLIATTIAVLLGILLSPYILKIMVPGFVEDQEKFSFTLWATVITFPSLFFISAASIEMGVLNSKGKFFLSSISPVFFNLGMIIFLPFAKNYPILGAFSFLFGCFLQFLFLLFFIGERYQKPDFKHPAISDFLKNWLSLGLNSGFLQLATFVNTFMASFLPTGSLAYLNYAFRLVQLPQGLVGVSFGTVLSKETSEKEGLSLKNLKKSLVIASVLALIFVLIFGLFGEFIIRVLFVRGKFTVEDAHNTYMAVVGYLATVPSFIYSSIFLSHLFATFKRKWANTGLAISTIVNIIFAPILVKLLGFVGIALAVSISQSSAIVYWSIKTLNLNRFSALVILALLLTLTFSLVLILFNLPV